MLDTDRSSHQRALWTALFVTVLWSSSWVLIRIGLEEQSLPPITFAGLRYFAAALVLWSWVVIGPDRRSEVASISASTWSQLMVLGFIFYAVTQGAQFVAIGAQPAATTSLLLAPTPFLVAVLSLRSIGEPVGTRQLGGAILIMIGSVLFFAGDLGATVIGVAAATVALLANTTSSLLGRLVNRQRSFSPLTVTVVSMTFGAILLVTVGLVVEEIPRLEWTALLIIAWLAVVNTAWAFTMWNASLRRLAAVESAAINNTMLVQIAILAWIFLGESPGMIGGFGIAVVSVGALLAQDIRLRVIREAFRRNVK